MLIHKQSTIARQTTNSKVEEIWKWFFVVLLAAQIGQKNAVQNLSTEFQQLFHIMTKKH